MCNLVDIIGWPQTHTGTGYHVTKYAPMDLLCTNEDFNWSLVCTDAISDNSCVKYLAFITYLCHMWSITRQGLLKKEKKEEELNTKAQLQKYLLASIILR